MAVVSSSSEISCETEATLREFAVAYDLAYEAAAQAHDLSVANACVLSQLHTAMNMSELAQELCCDASNVTHIIDRLQSRGLVERQTNPDDGRSRRVARTVAGQELNAELERSFDFARLAADRLSASEQRRLVVLLRKALGEATPGRSDPCSEESSSGKS